MLRSPFRPPYPLAATGAVHHTYRIRFKYVISNVHATPQGAAALPQEAVPIRALGHGARGGLAEGNHASVDGAGDVQRRSTVEIELRACDHVREQRVRVKEACVQSI